jgi:hypothetical protein
METSAMERFGFLLGEWDLDYRIPASSLHAAAVGRGHGSIRTALGGAFVIFDYEGRSGGETTQAHGIFGWDDKAKIYRYWWFESTGQSRMATGDFLDDETLRLNWHDTLIRQTFQRTGPDEVRLTMEGPSARGGEELVLEVIMSRKAG